MKEPVIIAAIITAGGSILVAIISNIFRKCKRDKEIDSRESGVSISNNRRLKIYDTNITGNVNIDKNKDVLIEGTDIHEKKRLDK
jgi:hypothetical protein